MIDVLFINASDSKKVYQDLSKDYSAIGTPYWALLLAQSCRSQGYKVCIIDKVAEQLDDNDMVKRIDELFPRLVVFCVYGENVNGGTAYMSENIRLSKILKKKFNIPISFVGSHVQALPYKTLESELSIDIVFTNEGVYALWNILKLDDIFDTKQLENVKGIGFRKNEKAFLTDPEIVVPQERMDVDLPGYAWDLLPYKEKPFDLYRSPMWHAEYDEEKRTPYASIYTSLGCKFQCEFCMINMVNRDDNEEIGVAGNYNKMRFWSPEFIIKEFDKLNEMGVKTIRIIDEMFLLNPKYYIPLLKLLSERPYVSDMKIWAYSRIDTIRSSKTLKLLRKAGIKWLALGIENANRNIRLKNSKGKFEDMHISDVVKKVHDEDIEIIANYMFGMPGDTMETMQQTLDLSLELNTMAWNAYITLPLPGSQLYKESVERGVELPEDYDAYSFHSYTTKPVPTETLTVSQILKFRDEAYIKYHTYKPFLQKVEKKFGRIATDNIKEMLKVKLKRKFYEV
jgi:anaerobic magnesium-protoporphyrin IX monomethyl ester cyclase